MALLECPECGSMDIFPVKVLRELAEVLEDGRKPVRCGDCDHHWRYGVATVVAPPKSANLDSLRQRFPNPDNVPAARRDRAAALKAEFLEHRPTSDPVVVQYWARYQEIFTLEGLKSADPQVFKDFANSHIGAYPGNMSVFNSAWNTMGPDAAAKRVSDAITYLLYGPQSTPIEDRLTHLIEGHKGLGMTGFREALLTKVLCVTRPDVFIPIVKYTGTAGKKEIAEWVYGLKLHEPHSTSWTIGRLVFWSNSLLRDLVGDGFVDMQHASQFLWWAKDRAAAPIVPEG
jgi:hypothetical protein